MKHRIVLCAVMLAWAAQAWGESIELMPGELSVSRISPSVYVATHSYPWESNSLIVATGTASVLFIDTPYTDAATEVLYRWVQKTFGPKRVEAVVTGYHIDNLGGIGYLMAQGVPVTGTVLTNRLIESNGTASLRTIATWLNPATQGRFIKHYTTVRLPTTSKRIELAGARSFEIDGMRFELFYPGESHAKDNLTVYLEGQDILFGSCIIKSLESGNLGFTGDANLSGWLAAVKAIKKRYPHVRTVVPHHGGWGGPLLLDHTLELLAVP